MLKRKVLFLCTGNSCRSQMAEGFLRSECNNLFEAYSAGMEPAPVVHPLAVEVMSEIGIDISSQKPKGISDYLGKESILYMIVVCDKAKKSCPRIWPGLPDSNRYYWPFDDPAEAPGSDEEKRVVFRRVRDEIHEQVKSWIETHKNDPALTCN